MTFLPIMVKRSFIYNATMVYLLFFLTSSARHSEKEFSKNSSLITRNAVSRCSIEAYSIDSPYTTRHHTHHQNRCILLRMWILYVHFTLIPLVTLKR